jgi:hypothetical protein
MFRFQYSHEDDDNSGSEDKHRLLSTSDLASLRWLSNISG